MMCVCDKEGVSVSGMVIESCMGLLLCSTIR